jgi:hypothetical protein
MPPFHLIAEGAIQLQEFKKMKSKRCLVLASIPLLLFVSVAHASQPAIVVSPNPVSFGTVALNVTGYPATIFVTNVSANPVTVIGMTISGASSSNFAFDGSICEGTISSEQSCQMALTFTPSTIGAISATLQVSYLGSSTPVNVTLQGTGGNPIPTITSLSPPSAYIGSAGFTLTINGTGFMLSSVAYWEDTALTTTYVSTTQITAQVPAAYLTSENPAYIQVSNPAPGGGFSPGLPFNVIGLDPSINDLSPNSLQAGSATTSITVNGGNFMNGAKVLCNGKPLPTTYISSTELSVQLTAKELAKPTIAQIAVSNPSPGGVSTPLNFNVTYPALVRILNLPANDIVWDPNAQKIYASLPSSFGTNGNSIAVIDPVKGVVDGYYFAGSEPATLAVSSDGQYLYVGLNGDGSVQRMILPSFALDINVSLGSTNFGGINTAAEIQVSPGDSHTFAVDISSGECCGGGGSLEFFTNSTLLANAVTYPAINSFQFANASTLYGYSYDVLSQVAVSTTGGMVTTQWNDILDGYGGIQYDAGLIYGSWGQVMNPATGELVGSYDTGEQGCCGGNTNDLLAESSIGRTFVVGSTPFFSSLGITSYDLSHFTPIAAINLSQLSGNLTPAFLSWGSNGLAFVLSSNTGCCGTAVSQVVLVQSKMMEAPAGENRLQ